MRSIKIGLSVIALLSVSLAGYGVTNGPNEAAEKQRFLRLFDLPGATGIPAPAAETYGFDPAHSTIGFSVRHLVINQVPGRFKEYQGTIHYDPADISKSAVEFSAKVASVDTGVQQRDNHLRSADFFDVAKFPDMAFKSTRVERKSKELYVAHGTFTLKGISKEITVPFKLFGPIKDPWGKMRIGVEANLTINRQDYGVAYNQMLEGGGLVVSNDVNVQLNIEAVKQ